jgi:hypothetical protein
MVKAFLIFFIAILNSNTDASMFQMTEKQKIEFLIQSVAKLEGAKFYRNGEWHSPSDAADHLRLKLNKAGNRIKTAQQFIDKIASESSMSGKPYKIKFKDGKIIETKVFLNQQLSKIEK